jgi:dTDP-glucose 4,6-dehydratase
MKILVTGGSGFIGRHLVRHLHQLKDSEGNERHDILNIDKLSYASNEEAHDDLRISGRYRFEQVDLCHADHVLEVLSEFAPDAVLHLAAESHVDRSIDGPADFIQSNVIGTFNLLQAARGHFQSLGQNSSTPDTFRFVHVSTDEVYGSLDFKAPGFTENSPYDPHSPYSASKAASDHLARAWCVTYGLPVIVTNCSNNYGPGQHMEKLIPTVISRALAGEPIPIYGDGKNVRDWLHVSDHVKAICAVLERGAVGETYNIGGNCELSNIDFARQICEILDRVLPAENSYVDQIVFLADRPGHDLRYAVDTRKIQEALGWKPEKDFQVGIEETVNWFVESIRQTQFVGPRV